MNKKKKSIAAKLVKFAHRRRFQDYVREKGREKMTLAYVYWAMWHRSGQGNVFELAEELFLADLGITNTALRTARRVLEADGWMKRGDYIPKHAKKWIVYDDSVTGLLNHPLTQSFGDSIIEYSVSDTVVLHPSTASPSTSSSTPEAYTASSEKREVSKEVSELLGAPRPSAELQDTPQRLYWSERNGREYAIEEAGLASDYLMELFPRSPLDERDSVLMADIALDFNARYPHPAPVGTHEHYADTVAESHTCSLIADYLAWNRKHKKGGMVHANVAEFHRAWFSDNDRCARIQWEDHDTDCKLCKLKAKVDRTPLTDKEVAAMIGRGFEHEAAEDFAPVGKGFDIEEA